MDSGDSILEPAEVQISLPDQLHDAPQRATSWARAFRTLGVVVFAVSVLTCVSLVIVRQSGHAGAAKHALQHYAFQAAGAPKDASNPLAFQPPFGMPPAPPMKPPVAVERPARPMMAVWPGRPRTPKPFPWNKAPLPWPLPWPFVSKKRGDDVGRDSGAPSPSSLATSPSGESSGRSSKEMLDQIKPHPWDWYEFWNDQWANAYGYGDNYPVNAPTTVNAAVNVPNTPLATTMTREPLAQEASKAWDNSESKVDAEECEQGDPNGPTGKYVVQVDGLEVTAQSDRGEGGTVTKLPKGTVVEVVELKCTATAAMVDATRARITSPSEGWINVRTIVVRVPNSAVVFNPYEYAVPQEELEKRIAKAKEAKKHKKTVEKEGVKSFEKNQAAEATERKGQAGVSLNMLGNKAADALESTGLRAAKQKLMQAAESREILASGRDLVGKKAAKPSSPTCGGYETGDFTVVHAGGLTVTEEAARASKHVATLEKDAKIKVVEVGCFPDDGRIRGRIESPAGWVSLRMTVGRPQVSWAMKEGAGKTPAIARSASLPSP